MFNMVTTFKHYNDVIVRYFYLSYELVRVCVREYHMPLGNNHVHGNPDLGPELQCLLKVKDDLS